MAPTDSTDPVYTVKEMVTEIRQDLKEVKSDVALLKIEAAQRAAVKVEIENRFSRRDKVLGAAFAVVTLGLNIFSLSAGPHLF